MAQVIRILRDMAMESGGYFDYSDFRARLSALKLDRSQTPFLYQRLDLLDSYLDLPGASTSDYFVDGGVTTSWTCHALSSTKALPAFCSASRLICSSTLTLSEER